MPRHSPIAEKEVPTVFTYEVVANLAAEVKLPFIRDMKRFAVGICASVVEYAVHARLPTPNTVHRQIAGLYCAAAGLRYEKAAEMRENMSDAAREIVENRARHMSRGLVVNGEPAEWKLPTPEQLRDPDRRDDACETIRSILSRGGRAKKGSSREYKTTLYGPAPSRAEPRRAAEKAFLMRLQAYYADATECKPPLTAHHDVPGSFAHFAAACLRLMRVPGSDLDYDRLGLAVQLINDIQRQRKLEKIVGDWRRIIESISRHEAIAYLGPLVEKGKVDICRVAGRDVLITSDTPPTLLEFPDTGQLHFHVSAKIRATLTIKALPRSRIMDLAGSLYKINKGRGRRRQHASA
jgi:hypothetical protein